MTIQTPVPSTTPPETLNIPKYMFVGLILIGFLSAGIASNYYSGKFLITLLTSPRIYPLLKNDVVTPPGVGFDYLHNLNKFPSTVTSEFKIVKILTGRIRTVPKDIGTLTNLQVLQISDNRLTGLPSEIGNLIALESLNLGGNKLKTIPDAIGNLTNLKKLYLYNNKIDSLPNTLGALTNLEILDIHDNALKSLPTGIGNLVNLKTLYLGGNQISKVEQQKIVNALPNTQIFF